jgi:xanthine/uracil/vitamin C permease (AzgA family)
MTVLLDFLEAHRTGFLMLILCLVPIGFFVQWIAWIFSIGRFRSEYVGHPRQDLRFVFSEAAVKIINDFRHLLALVVIAIFGFTLWYAMDTAPTMKEMREALQAVVATLGGLVGSIIGYYFGESAVTKAQEAASGDSSGREVPTPAIQGLSGSITPVPAPPDQPNQGESPSTQPAPPVEENERELN